MLWVAVWVVGVAVAAGAGLGGLYLRGGVVTRFRVWGGYGHGILGVVGVVLAVLAGGKVLALGMLVGAALGGVFVFWAHWRGRPGAGLAVMLHAAFGVGGFLLLLGG